MVKTLSFKINKYVSISYFYFKQAKIYWQNMVLGCLSSVIIVFISCSMWIAVYSSDNFFEKNGLYRTITNILIVNLLNTVMSNNIEMDIGNSVRDGNISINFIKPVNYIAYIFFQKLGLVIIKLICLILPILVLITYLEMNYQINFYMVCSFIISYLMIFAIEFIVGLCSFVTTQIFGLSLIKSSIINVTAGLSIPIYYYPDYLQKIIYNLPFQSIYSSPIYIYEHRVSYNIIQSFFEYIGLASIELRVILEQLFWLGIIGIIGRILWIVCKKKLSIQGG